MRRYLLCAVVLAAVALAVAAVSAGAQGLPQAPGCEIFPPDNPWNQPVTQLPVDPNSAQYVAAIGASDPVHPDFGTVWDGAPNGIPYTVVGAGQPKVPVSFQYADESDPGPYPIPPDAAIEGGPDGTGDRHVIVVDSSTCTDYELWDAYPVDGGASWTAGSGAVFNLSSDALRPAGWTSADAAGLPILPGLARYDEDASGVIDHALRFTASCTAPAYIYPARHMTTGTACSGGALSPPMGLRLRLKASVNTSELPTQAGVIAQAMKTYGIVLADNGSPWYISGAPDPSWNDDALHQLDQLTGSDFEVVDFPQAPISTAAPTISGTPVNGHTLTASTGTWLGAGNAYTYAWEDCTSAGAGCMPITGATAATYTVQSSDAGHALVVAVIATNIEGHATAQSAPTAPVSAAATPPVNTTPPLLNGTAVRAQTLKGTAGSWTGTPNSFAYTWEDCTSAAACTPITGATSATYTLQAADEGHAIILEVTATGADGTASALSAATAPVAAAPPINTHIPVISGIARTGSVLKITQTAWLATPDTLYRVVWHDCTTAGKRCTAIAAATAGAYTVRKSDTGYRIKVTVSARNIDGSASASSALTAVSANSRRTVHRARTRRKADGRGRRLARLDVVSPAASTSTQ
jgi:hypothetical protein